jgi:hypothetical protein
LALIIQEYTADGFINLPQGQRALILAKVFDVVGSNDARLDFAAEGFLELMLTRGVFLGKEDYREIVRPSIQWAFEKHFEGAAREGRETIRKALELAAFTARDGAFEVLSEETLAYLEMVGLSSKEDWYLHTLRDVVEALMANPTCESAASELAKYLRNINSVQRSRPRGARLPF